MESVAHQEGRIFNTVNSNTANWRYEYNITDHLGNTRLTFADKTPDGIIKIEDGEVLEEAHYYPFGLAMEGPWMNDAAALDTRYKFNGIERVQDFGLNVDMAMFRSYDPAIGRWWQADPIAKAWENPYAAMYNNPMNWSDMLGADPGKDDGGEDPIDGGNLPVFEVRAKRTNKNSGNLWNSLYIAPYQYSSSDYDDSRYSVVSDSGPRDGKVAANALINIWNGTVSTAQTVAERRVIQSVTTSLEGMYNYFRYTPGSQMADDLMNEENADEALSFGFAASLGLARFGVGSGFNSVKGFKNAISSFKGGRLTNAGRAVTKHPQYFGFDSFEALSKVYKTPEALNSLAAARLKDILRNGKKTTGAGGRYPNGWVTYTLPNGKAASWSTDGVFIGFRGLK